MAKITSVSAIEILDSRGNPTMEVKIKTKNASGRAAAPSGASTGKFEAVELRDGGKRYLGKGVLSAVANVNKEIAKALVGIEVSEQEKIDKKMIELDGTKNKSRLGGNAIVATSMAALRCAANESEKELFEYLGGKTIPQPMFNILNGGKHAGTGLAIQEFMIVPKGKTFAETLQMASEIYHVLGKILVERYGPPAKNVGDEGGYAPPINKTEDALNAIIKAVDEAGYSKQTSIAMDCAASSFYDGITKTYYIDERGISAEMLRRYYGDFIKRYPLASIEDPFDEEDFGMFSLFCGDVGKKIMVVGDDLLVTNPGRIKKAIEEKSCNALLLKVNQVGTVSESISAAKIADEAGWDVIVSHRSGETEDTFIADFAVGIGAGYIKTGAPARGERTAKYNQLLRIENQGARWER